MGARCSIQNDISGEDKERRELSKAIDKLLAKELAKNERPLQLLLLGAGDSGKSTICKQLKVIHKKGFTEEELSTFKTIIHCNVLDSIRVLLYAADRFGYEVSSENQSLAARYSTMSLVELLTPNQAKEIKQLWADPVIQETWTRNSEIHIHDQTPYFFEHVDRICQTNYVPTQDDCLRCRTRTTGIVETQFVIENTPFKLVDVGGQRSERRKWIHVFEGVTAVLFCASLSEYNQRLVEDNKTNRMLESLSIFQQTCQTKWFDKSSIILFLNKVDLFQEKIKKHDLNSLFPEYTGGCDFKKASEFIQGKFMELNTQPATRQVYCHVTCATDTKNIRFVFESVQDTLFTNHLVGVGF